MSKSIRKSNMELLRIVAMFLVLLVHADFFSLGAPTASECVGEPIASSLKVFFEVISIACVDIFVCLSGWFGIKPTARGFLNFVFQCLFWLIGIYVVTLTLGLSELSIQGLKGCLVLTPLNWFIKAYILLYILSPVLNSFVESATSKQFRIVLFGFFTFEFIYGWLFSGATQHIQQGYSTISFIGLYLLTRYIRIYQPKFASQSSTSYIMLLSILSICVTVLYIMPPILGFATVFCGSVWISYISPFCILCAITMLLLFSKFEIQNKIINWIAASSFAVFLIHTNPNTLWHFKSFFVNLYGRTCIFEFWIYTFGVLILIFIVAVLIDQIRIAIWNFIWKRIALDDRNKK